jgi:hypothetical protein
MSVKEKSYNIAKLPKIYRTHMQQYFPDVNFTEDENDVQLRLAKVNNNSITLAEFYDMYCEENEFQPDEKECCRLFRQLLSSDPAEQGLAQKIIFKISNRYKTLKKALTFFNNFLNVENIDYAATFEIQMIHNSIRDFLNFQPHLELKLTSQNDSMNFQEYIDSMIKIYQEKHVGE